MAGVLLVGALAACGERPFVVERIVLEDWEAPGTYLWSTGDTVAPPAGFARGRGTRLDPPRGQSQRAFRLDGVWPGRQLTGHAHQQIPADATLVFWAKFDRGTAPVIVAFTGDVERDFAGTGTRGRPWMGKEVSPTLSWSELRVPFAELRPLGDGMAEPLFSHGIGMIHFIIKDFDGGALVTLWIDDIVLECPRSCDSPTEGM